MFTMIRDILNNLSSRPATRPYPKVKREPVAGSRGRLEVDPDVCVYCTLCAKGCPANALSVTRKPKTLTWDRSRCIVCGYCLEICPKDCLFMNPSHN